MIFLCKLFTRAELHDLLRETALAAIIAERPNQFAGLRAAVVHAECRHDERGGMIVEFHLAEPEVNGANQQAAAPAPSVVSRRQKAVTK